MASSLMVLHKFTLLFLLASTAFLSPSFAGRRFKFMNKLANQVDMSFYEEVSKPSKQVDEASMIHERLLRANTKDYGNYDPAPALGKPPFKLIPN
ncbi:protein CASPARIAN STRIP INTEGRITY FACTOR 1-like [Manihot esculenta]|uniref:Uncharacterized protein n=1 Tax=Manihot esculenta TaxID=3983 RepID=A0ACB7HW53_MANES|nr:protein CASPARIAN STRIP INTEGRITY FACTOR 1-like [Manihot esculenta]KAG8655923.1 hypothetical protein MANES_04G087299v8 [Manihot esculenta]